MEEGEGGRYSGPVCRCSCCPHSDGPTSDPSAQKISYMWCTRATPYARTKPILHRRCDDSTVAVLSLY